MIERAVRILVGLPIAVSYLYIRHYSLPWAHFALLLGIFIMLAAFVPAPRLSVSRLSAPPRFPLLEDWSGFILLILTFLPSAICWQVRRGIQNLTRKDSEPGLKE